MSVRRPAWSETIALFGGRFDPPHLGHQEAIQGLFKNPGVSQVWVLPSPTPPHKTAVAAFEHRAEMARLGFPSLHDKVRIDLREAKRAATGPTYTFDTLQEIRRETTKISFVIGTDQLADFHRWYRFNELLKLANWIVLERKSEQTSREVATINEWQSSGLIAKTGENGLWEIAGGSTFLLLAPTDAPALSSTAIRESLAKTGNPPQNTLHPDVFAYLKQHRLYGTKGNPI